MNKSIIVGKNISELSTICIENKFPKFHGEQLYKWLYQKSVNDITKMSNIPDSLKIIINKKYKLNPLKIEKKLKSKNEDTIKYLFKTNDHKLIESVSMIDSGRHTLCISSQIGCSVDCDFCATGKMGIIRNLNCGEIIQQLISISAERKQKITNIVFMGMGEPFLNYANVIKACEIINDPSGFNLSSKRITISTSGILPIMKQFILEKHKYKLAISLNASNNSDRDKLIPINKKWPIEDILDTIKDYKYQKYRPIMFEYVLIDGVNDSIENAIELSKLLKKIHCKINIIPYNETEKNYKRSKNIEKFVTKLNEIKSNYRVLIRWSKGQDIDAACGQLATLNE
tara:strand:+ start:1019 stop:2044 length:1026 start_codon:yes stop_codon:yes gene_type:complete